MSTRDRPRLSDRFRGKTGSDLMNEIKKEFEDNKKAWFADRPSSHFNSFRREGFPFENDDVFSKKSDAGIKSHLEDLAKKHPEFANNLKCPPWGGSLKDTWDKAFTVPVSVVKDSNGSTNQQQSSSQNQFESQAPTQGSQQQVSEDTSSKPVAAEDGLNQHGLRNTVDIVELNKEKEANEEPKRASSAPPDTAPVDNRPIMNKPEQKRFTSKIEITPVNPFEENSANAPSANGNSGSSNSANAATDNKMSSNHAREIPIQTSNADNMGSPHMTRSRTSSGAREIPIHTERVQTHSPFDSPTIGRKQPQVRQIPIFVEGRKSPVMAKEVEETIERGKQFPQEQVPLKRKLDTNSGRATPPQSSNGQSQQKQQPPHEREVPTEQSPPAPQPPPPPPKPKDPMERIQEVKDEVESLSNRIQQYIGKSRADKEYLFLDEMLTRNLIKLDTIEVEGNDALRTARKDVIRNIQKSIALLESKVPSGSGDAETNDQSGGCASTTNTDNSETKEPANEEKKN